MDPQAFGCGPLSLAVLAQDESRVETLLDTSPSFMDETTILGLTPLHLALDKPACLRLLISRSTRAQLNSVSFQNLSLLFCSMMIYSEPCIQGLGHATTQSDHLLECMMALLEDNRTALQCEIFTSIWDNVSGFCRHAVKMFAKQLKVRRDALKQTASRHLTRTQRLELGLNTPAVLDINAQLAANLLYEKGLLSFFEAYGVSFVSLSRSSVYHHLSLAEEAAIFYEMGFQDVSASDTHGITPLVAATRRAPIPGIIIKYLIWLIQHGADVSSPSTIIHSSSHTCDTHSAPARGTTHAHHIAAYAASWYEWRPAVSTDCVTLLSRHVLAAGVVDKCSCGCSLHGCTPATVLFRPFLRCADDEYRPTSFDLPYFQPLLKCAGTIEDTAWIESATRVLTFNALGLTHTCCRTCDCSCRPSRPIVLVDRCDTEEVDDIRDVESDDLGLLEALVGDFQARLEEISSAGPLQIESYENFLRGYWQDRMRAEREKKRQNRTWEEEKQDTICLGVNWEETVSEAPSEVNEVSEVSEVIEVGEGSEGSEVRVTDEAKVAKKDILSVYIEELDWIVAGKPPFYCPRCRSKPCRRREDCSHWVVSA